VFRLDYLSCILTVTSTILVGRRCWKGWLLATVNSVIMCIIGIKTAQLGFIPANVFCIGISVINLRAPGARQQHPKTQIPRHAAPADASLRSEQALRKRPLFVDPLRLAAEAGIVSHLEDLLR